MRCGCVATLRQRRSRLGVRVHTDIAVAPKPSPPPPPPLPPAIPALSLSHSTRAVLLHPPAPTASPALPRPSPAAHRSLFRSPSLSVPTDPAALPPPALSGTRHQVLYILYHSFPVSRSTPCGLLQHSPFLPFLPSFFVRIGLCISLLCRSWISSESHTPTSLAPFFSFPFFSLPARVIKVCLRVFVSQLPLSGLSKFILTLLHSSLALSHRDLVLHLTFSCLSARLSFRLAVSLFSTIFYSQVYISTY